MACARLRLAALIGVRLVVIVVRSVPFSNSAAASSRIWCCTIMSAVWNCGRVNMSSHANVTLFAMSGPRSSGFVVPTIEQILPCGTTIDGKTAT